MNRPVFIGPTTLVEKARNENKKSSTCAAFVLLFSFVSSHRVTFTDTMSSVRDIRSNEIPSILLTVVECSTARIDPNDLCHPEAQLALLQPQHMMPVRSLVV
jgi:hypothetical protein